jgi:uncharacterized membrane protein YphA (DoxX/SURF4 family)
MDPRLSSTFNTLRLTYGLVPIVAGLDKFANLLTDWGRYLSPSAASVLPFSPQAFMYAVGVIEIAAGILTLLKPRIGAWVVSAWLLAIALNLVVGGFYDIAVRDIVMAVGGVALARLAQAYAEEKHPAGAQQARTARAHA